MRCIQLTLVNYGNFAYKVVDFSNGLNGIIGPNGSGKSHILGGIRYALTGVNISVGTKDDNIFDRAATTDSSYVRLVFEHNGLQLVVQRNIRPAKPVATLSIDGGKEIEGDANVTTRIEQILGVPSAVINDIVIVAQEDIFGFLSKKPQQRAEQFQRLFNTSRSTEIYAAIGEHLRGIEIPTVAVQTNAVRNSIADAELNRQAVIAQLAQCRTYEVIDSIRDQHVALLQQFEQRGTLLQQLQASIGQEQQLQRAIQTVREQLIMYTEQRAAVEANVTAAVVNAENAKQQLATLQLLQQQQETHRRVSEKLRLANAALDAAIGNQPTKPVDFIEDEAAASHQLAEAQHALTVNQTFVNSFSGGVSECPTCHTTTTQLTSRLAEAVANIPQLQAKVTELQRRLQSTAGYKRAISDYNREYAGALAMHTAFKQEYDSTPVPQQLTLDAAELNGQVSYHQRLTESLKQYDGLMQRADTELAGYTGQLTAITNQLQQQRELLSGLQEYSPETYQQSVAAVAGLAQESAYRRNVESQLAGYDAQLKALQTQLQQCESVQKRADLYRAWHTRMESVRGLFHKDAAPRLVAQRNLQHLQTAINELLRLFSASYVVEADEGLTFRARFPNGSNQPAERLSGGQKVILACAFRMVLNLMFAENIGALYLDEPTSWLDEQHIRGFEPVMNHLRAYASSRGLQCIIVTHERSLAPLFDSVIAL